MPDPQDVAAVTPSKFSSRKYRIALLVLLATIVLAFAGKLNVTVAGVLLAILALYNRANLQQKRDALEAKAEGVEP